jgi:2',3'-cyclic-nucleotide 2'-phosphodiesterase (5'-nucleotidase family)
MLRQFTQILVLFYFSCGLYSQQVHILQSTDIHSCIFDGESHHNGSWLRMATKIKNLRQKYKKENTLLIDCGDTIQGSLSGYLSQGQAAIEMLNHLNYDAWVPGNHELDFGSSRFEELANKTTIPMLSANFRFTNDNAPRFLPWKTYRRAGKNICVIGMQASYLAHWSYGSQFKDCSVSPAITTLKKIIPKIQLEQPDYIILAMHHGLVAKDSRGVNEALAISRLFPEIKLILGGHTHRSIPGLLTSSKVYYVQAGQHAEQLGHITIDLQTDKIESELITINEATPTDPEAMKLMSSLKQKYAIFKVSEICQLKLPIKHGRPGINCQISALIAEAIRRKTNAHFALHGRFSATSLGGIVTEQKLFDLCPYENTIFTAELNHDELQMIMQEQLTQIKSYSFNAPHRFKAIVTKNNKLIKLELPGSSKKVTRYKVAFNSRLAADGGGRFPLFKKIISQPQAKLTEHRITTREAIRDILRNNPPSTFNASIIRVTTK